ncbi:acetoacetate--CoA ligase [Vibrio scophthalmi]|uniref:acetoacetate--CoA ligase n=1 Tax=Vibrio scophthalmi TaxID=45658 RepID=UPI002FF42087
MTDSSALSPELLWSPTTERQRNANMAQFIQHINMQGQAIESYQDLHTWSVENPNQFWLEIWQVCDVIGYRGECIKGEGLAKHGQFSASRDTIWFPQAQLNYAENLLAYAYQRPNNPAIWFHNESGVETQLSWQALCDQVSIVQQWLRHNGVERGDVVAGYLPHCPQAVIAMLATTSLGAVWTSTSPDFGVDSVVERFGQVQPKILFCCNGYQFSGKTHSMVEKNGQICDAISSITNTCQIEYLADHACDLFFNEGFSDWESVLSSCLPRGIKFARVGFNDPLFILYSSGTTGKPKCIVHSVGGTTLNHLKEHQLHCDIKPNDRVFYYTTCGWMMWNWHVSALASGATLVIYDGSPVYPTPATLWSLAERAQVSLFGTSAKYLEAIEKAGYTPKNDVNLSSLKTLCSTGSVLYPNQYHYVYDKIKSDLHLASISGGTDICGCFVLGNPLSPVYVGECQGPGLGLDVAVFDEKGQAVTDQRGELVCRNSFPNQPLGFWHDDGRRYHQAYWARFANTWHHGDDVQMSQTGGVRFFGRSDATLNPGGVRIGSAEIYQQVNQLPEVLDSIAVGRVKEGDETIVLFVQLAEGGILDERLKTAITARLRSQCSPRHVPSEIYALSDIPKTKSGKLVELAVKQVLHGETIKNLGAIANPEVLEEVRRYQH